MGLLKDYVIEQAEKKNKVPSEWLTDVLDKIDSCTLATHVGKFTHPDSKISIYNTDRDVCAGYVSSSNSLCQTDIVVNAAYLATASILLKELEDGQVVLAHFQKRTDFLAAELAEFGIDMEKYADMVGKISAVVYPDKTEGILKQVYFPVEDSYKVLTVLPSSSLFLTLGMKLQAMRKNYKECNEEKSAKYGQPRAMIPNLTAITFGGTKPQNISALNSRYGKAGRLLPALPPVWSVRNVRLPKRNFFGEVISGKNIQFELNNLYGLFTAEWNNQQIRNSIKNIVDSIVDDVIHRADEIIMLEAGWSDKFSRLPEHQKIWLDIQFIECRSVSMEWIEETGRDFGRWMAKAVCAIKENNKMLLGDGETAFLAERLCSRLKEELR